MESAVTNQGSLGVTSKVREEWFSAFIHDLKSHQLFLDTNTAPTEMKKFYDTLMSGDDLKIIALMKEGFMNKATKLAVINFLTELKERNANPTKLAFDFSGLTLSIWAVIKDNDEATEDALILAEAKTNSIFFKCGLHISSIILEESDKIALPPHYSSVY